jgi:hypothetical protein
MPLPAAFSRESGRRPPETRLFLQRTAPFRSLAKESPKPRPAHPLELGPAPSWVSSPRLRVARSLNVVRLTIPAPRGDKCATACACPRIEPLWAHQRQIRGARGGAKHVAAVSQPACQVPSSRDQSSPAQILAANGVCEKDTTHTATSIPDCSPALGSEKADRCIGPNLYLE